MLLELEQFLADGRYDRAFAILRAMVQGGADAQTLERLAKRLERFPVTWREGAGFIHKKLAVIGGYTTQFVTPALRTLLFEKKITVEIFESEYGVHEQIILGADPTLTAFRPDACYFMIGSDHLGLQSPEEEVARWQLLFERAATLLTCPLFVNTFEEPAYRVYGSYEAKAANSRTSLIRYLNSELSRIVPPSVHFVDINWQASVHGRLNWRNDKFYDVAKTPVSFEFLPTYAKSIAEAVAAQFGRSKKALILDLDNTLWGGVVGDDGLAGIKIGEDSEAGEAFLRFQKYIKALKDRGVILAVCSKNEAANAREPFEKRTDMALRLTDISCFVANWQPKHINVVAIAEALSIGLDSLVFVDDNPAEREIIRQNLPDVTVLELPTDPADYVRCLAASGHFETVFVTKEDLERSQQYAANEQRVQSMAQAMDYGQYLSSLEMRAVAEAFDESNLPRIHQLINKTNQFNLTTPRYSEFEVRQLMTGPGCVTRYIKLKDKFGDNGLIGVFAAKEQKPGIYDVDLWLMSCRVLKRGVENFLFKNIVNELKSRGATRLNGRYIPTPKNAMVGELLPSLGFKPEKRGTDGTVQFSLDLTSSAELEATLASPCYIRRVSPEAY